VVNAPGTIAGAYGNTATVDWAPVGNGATGDVVYVGRACPAGAIGAGVMACVASLFWLGGGLLVGLVVVLMAPAAVSHACLRPHDGGDHAPLLRLVLVQAVEEGLGVGVGGQDIELADRHVVRLLLRHVHVLCASTTVALAASCRGGIIP